MNLNRIALLLFFTLCAAVSTVGQAAGQGASQSPAQGTVQSAAGANADLNQELIAAARKSNVEAVKALLAKGADANAKTEYGATPLFFACDRGNAQIVALLLDKGADPTVRDTFYKSSPLEWAVQRDHAEVVRLLLEKSKRPKEPVMLMAVQMGQPKTVRALLATGGFMPEDLSAYLASAEKNKQTEIIEALRAAGAQAKPPAKQEYKVDAASLKLYEGVYKDDQTEVTVKLQDGQLVGGPPGEQLKLIPIDKHTFEPEGVAGAKVIFKIEGERATELTFRRPDGNESVMKRVEAK